MFFDPEITEETGFSAGQHKVVIAESSWDASRNGEMQMMMQIQSVNSSASRRFWLSLENQDTQGEIARKHLAQLCRALKMNKAITDENELVAFFQWAAGRPFGIQIKVVEKNGSTYYNIQRIFPESEVEEPKPVASTGGGNTDEMPF